MASGKRQPSKQKRSSQNRQQRQALQQRKVAASAPPVAASNPKKVKRRGTSSSAAPDTSFSTSSSNSNSNSNSSSNSSSSSTRTSATSGAPRTPGSLLGRLRGTPAVGPAPSASRARVTGPRSAAPATGNRRRSDQPPGYSAALAGVLAAVAAAVATVLLHAPVDASGDSYTSASMVAEWSTSALHEVEAAPTATPTAVVEGIDDWMPGRTTDRLFLVYFPLSLAVVFPAIGALLTFRAVKQRQPAKVVTRSMYITLLGAFLTLTLLQLFLPAVIAVTVASYQVRKQERRALQAAAADDAVIEADVVDG